MEPQTQLEPQLNQKKPPRRSAAWLVIPFVIIIAALIGLLIWCWFYKDHPAASPGGTATTPAATGPCAGGAANIAPVGFTFYENAELGFKFAYPSAWGTVAISATPMGGIDGHYLQGSFSANTNVTFGGNATDYVVNARGGIPTDNPGYLVATNKFYGVQIWKIHEAGRTEDRTSLYPITEPSTLKNGCNAKALVTQYPHTEFYGYSYDVARFNLQPSNAYYGVNFVVKNPDAAARTDLDKLIGTFQLIP